jgi:GTP-binding protein
MPAAEAAAGFHPPPSSFVTSAVKPRQYPDPDRPEIAFAGRSNVGKSSLINHLLGRRKLARTSRQPGRTQTINFFAVGRDCYFVDLPGYGYAKVPLAVKAAWGPMVEGYLAAPRDIRGVVLLIDIRRQPGDEERALLDYLDRYHRPALVVLTKADKVPRGKRPARVQSIAKDLGGEVDPVLFSAASGLGRPAVWDALLDAVPELAPGRDGQRPG